MIIGKAISPFAIKRRNGTAPTDADAQAFITASGISGTNATAINTLVVNLKSANVWTKIKAAYPMVGGTATSCKWNLKDARDLEAAFRLAFAGGGTFSSNGYLPNGLNSFANTYLIPQVNLTNNNNHISFYSRTDANGLYADMGSSEASATSQLGLYGRYLGNSLADSGTFSQSRITAATANSLGFYTSTRTANNVFKLFKNGSSIGTNITTNTVALLPNQVFTIGGYNENGNVIQVSIRQCAFASIGDGLTDAEALAFYNAVQTFNTTLNRQV